MIVSLQRPFPLGFPHTHAGVSLFHHCINIAVGSLAVGFPLSLSTGDGLARLVLTRRSLAFMSAWTLLEPYIRMDLSQGYGARPLYDIGKHRFGIRNRMGWVVFVWTGYWEDTSYSYWGVSMELWRGDRVPAACRLTTLAQRIIPKDTLEPLLLSP